MIDVTMIIAAVLIMLALGVGVAVDRRRGVKAGFAIGFGVLAAGVVGVAGVLALSLPM